MAKSWHHFENGCIPMHCGATMVRIFTARRIAHNIVTLFVRTSTSAWTRDSCVTVI